MADVSAEARAKVDVTPLGSGRYLVTNGQQQSVAYAVGPAAARWVFLNGRVYVIDTTPMSGRVARAHDDDLALAAPMPATVVMINVSVGQQVARGDVMIMLEAMKMELPIRAPRDGRVASIACGQGELVRPGTPLVELE